MCRVDLGVEKYIGLDIVKLLIDSNNKLHKNSIESFDNYLITGRSENTGPKLVIFEALNMEKIPFSFQAY